MNCANLEFAQLLHIVFGGQGMGRAPYCIGLEINKFCESTFP